MADLSGRDSGVSPVFERSGGGNRGRGRGGSWRAGLPGHIVGIRVALLLAIIAGFALVAYADLERARDRAIDDALRQTDNLARMLEADALNTLTLADRAVTAMIAASGAAPAPGPIAAFEPPSADGDIPPALREVLTTDADGRVTRSVVASQAQAQAQAQAEAEARTASGRSATDFADGSPSSSAEGFDLFEAQRSGSGDGLYLSTPFRAADGGWRVGLSRRLTGPNGGFAGVAAAVIDLEHFARLYASLDLGARGMALLYHRDGAILAYSRPSSRLDRNRYAFAKALPQVPPGERTLTLSGVADVDGQDRVGTVRALPDWPLMVMVRLGSVDVLASWHEDLWLRALETATLSVVLGFLALQLLRQLGRLEKATQALRASERQSQALFDSSFQVMGLLSPDGRVMALNQPACALAGLPPDAMIGHPAWAFRGWARTEEMAAAFRQSIEKAASGRFIRYETDILSDGETRIMDVSIKPVFDERGRVALLVTEARDITERKNAEVRLRDSEARLRSYLDAAMEGFFISGPDGRYVDVNPAACQSLGYSREEILEMRVPDLVACDHPLTQASREGFRTVARVGVFRGEMVLRRKDGSIARAEVNAVRLDNGRYLGVTRDITERVEVAERLAAAKEQAEAANEAKSAFLATMSHELRTPLNAIIGFSEIMLHELFGPLGSPRYHEYARHVQNSGRHLLDLINDVLDMSKLEAGRYTLDETWLSLGEVLETCRSLAAVPAERGGVEVRMECPSDLPGLLADERALRQVMLNLLSNAVKFTPRGGRVSVTAAVLDGCLCVLVRDTGIGIPAEALQRIAEPFQQADSSIARRFGGTGLGLTISRDLMRLHGGELCIASQPGEGTSVTIRFPAARVASPAATEALPA